MGDAVRVTASEFTRNFVRYQDHAIAGDIVQVTSEGRVIGGFISAQELERFERLKARERQVWRLEDLTDDMAADIETAEYGLIRE